MDLKTRYLTALQKAMVDFLADLQRLLPQDEDIVMAKVIVSTSLPAQDMMDYIVASLLPEEKVVEARDDHFFLDHDVLFGAIDPSKVNKFKSIWTSALAPNDRKIIWEWFDCFMNISKRYKALTA